MIYTCETCGNEFKGKPAAARRFCSRSCVPRVITPKPVGPPRDDLERLVIRQARALAVELGTRYLDLFTGPRADWARRVVCERVRRLVDDGTPAVLAAVNAALIAGNHAEVAA